MVTVSFVSFRLYFYFFLSPFGSFVVFLPASRKNLFACFVSFFFPWFFPQLAVFHCFFFLSVFSTAYTMILHCIAFLVCFIRFSMTSSYNLQFTSYNC